MGRWQYPHGDIYGAATRVARVTEIDTRRGRDTRSHRVVKRSSAGEHSSVGSGDGDIAAILRIRDHKMTADQSGPGTHGIVGVDAVKQVLYRAGCRREDVRGTARRDCNCMSIR